MAYVPNSGSVAAWLQGNNTSVFTTQKAGSILAVSGTVTNPAASITAVAIVSGSVAATFTPPANQSVSGAITAPPGSVLTVATLAGSTMAVLATQVTSPWIVAPNNSSLFSLQPAGSILAVSGSFSPAGNQSVSGAVTAPAGSVMTVAALAGSIIAVSGAVTAPAGSIMATNQVAGSVMAVAAGSVAAFIVGNASVITVSKDSSVISLQLAGSILATSATVLPGSVSGAVTAPPGSVMTVATLAGSIVAVAGTVTAPAGSIISVTTPAGSTMAVLATQVTSPWIVAPNNSSLYSLQLAGSILATSATVLPGSVSGAITAPPGSVMQVRTDIASVITTQPAGSIMAVSAVQPAGSLLTAIQLAGSVMAVSGSFTPAANQSVSGAVTSPPGSVMSVTAPAGSTMAVLATQVTSPWIVAPNNSSMFAVPVGSYVAVQMAGSIMATSATVLPGSVSGAVTAPPGSVMTVATLAGSIVAVSGTVVAPAGSVMTIATLAGSIMAVSATQATTPWVVAPNNTSIVGTYQEETVGGPSIKGIALVWESNANTSVMSTVSPTNPLRISGSVSGTVFATAPAGSIMTTVRPAGSITAVSGATTTTAGSIISATFPAGSIAAVSGATTTTAGSIISAAFPAGSVAGVRTDNASVIAIFQNSSILAVPVGSTIALLQAASIVGTYAEDVAHATADKGLFIMGVRNDAVSSVTTAERDYSPVATDDVGRLITVPFAGQQACIISFVGSTVSGSVMLVKASVVGSRSYITDFWIANTGSVAQLVTFQGGDTSVLAYTMAPAGGGSNAPGIAVPLRTTLSQDLAVRVTGTSSVVYITVKGYQAP